MEDIGFLQAIIASCIDPNASVDFINDGNTFCVALPDGTKFRYDEKQKDYLLVACNGATLAEEIRHTQDELVDIVKTRTAHTMSVKASSPAARSLPMPTTPVSPDYHAILKKNIELEHKVEDLKKENESLLNIVAELRQVVFRFPQELRQYAAALEDMRQRHNLLQSVANLDTATLALTSAAMNSLTVSESSRKVGGTPPGWEELNE